jgi:hypothetical protein
VTDRPHVHVRLAAYELLLGHGEISLSMRWGGLIAVRYL